MTGKILVICALAMIAGGAELTELEVEYVLRNDDNEGMPDRYLERLGPKNIAQLALVLETTPYDHTRIVAMSLIGQADKRNPIPAELRERCARAMAAALPKASKEKLHRTLSAGRAFKHKVWFDAVAERISDNDPLIWVNAIAVLAESGSPDLIEKAKKSLESRKLGKPAKGSIEERVVADAERALKAAVAAK